MSLWHFHSGEPAIFNLYIQVVTLLFNWTIWNNLIVLFWAHDDHIRRLNIDEINWLIILKNLICKIQFKTWWIKTKYETIWKA